MTPTPEQLKARWNTEDGQKRLTAIKQAQSDGLVDWNAISHQFPPTREFKGKDLRGIDLRGFDLENADFTEVDFRHADLRDVNLRNACLSGTDLRGVYLVTTDLRGAEFIEADLREANLSKVDLRDAFLYKANLGKADLREAKLGKVNLREAILRGADMRTADLDETDFYEADLRWADLRNAYLRRAFLVNTYLCGANLGDAYLYEANLQGADLTEACFAQANLSEAILKGCRLVNANLEGANISGASVFGVSVWGLKLDNRTKQDNIIITDKDEPLITVDDIRVAQFIYLLLTNKNIRDVIDTITSKVVLILGRFTPKRKAVLDAIRQALRNRGYCPVMFDFERSKSRDFIETVSTLAHMARFVLADFTAAKIVLEEVPHIVRNLAVPVQPLMKGKGKEPVTLYNLRRNHLSLLATHRYRDTDDLIATLDAKVIAPAEAKARELSAK